MRTTTTAGRNRVRRGLVVAEIALAVMLVIGAGLLIRSFENLTSVDAGFDPANRVDVRPGPAGGRVSGFAASRAAFARSVAEARTRSRACERVSAMQGLPPFRQVNANDTNFEGYIRPGSSDPLANVDYYQTVTRATSRRWGSRSGTGRASTPATPSAGRW